ncbi:MAG: hypothetical protein GWM87_03150, partial [Xanthomonadales bacterium]|nr:hypothetical protein [Xanthomonadales bacterium]NIX12042.1 hypothetical protein [Xanthomonadales bacterium]
PGSLSLTFADNIGSDNTVVFSGPLTLTSADIGGPPRDFDIIINLQTPFFYDPGDGNLLLDVRRYDVSVSSTVFFDAHNSPVDTVSRSYAAGNVTSTVALWQDQLGLVTQFDIALVVEIDIKFC